MAIVEEQPVEIGAQDATLAGDLAIPAGAQGLVVFAHGSGSSRRSPRNREVAAGLREQALGTLLFDLLSDAEARSRENVFDIALLCRRLVEATRWCGRDEQARSLPLGYFGASTGAAAALCAAGELGERVGAVVSRGGRPDLAQRSLPQVTAPTLLIVGERDPAVVDLNRAAAAELRCPHELAVVPQATHLFEEPGALDRVTELAAKWFTSHLGAPAP